MTVAPYPAHGWCPDKTATGDPRRPRPLVLDAEWGTCPLCWGQGRIYSGSIETGRITGVSVCPGCLGVSSVPTRKGWT